MPIRIAVPHEHAPDERRVAMVPEVASKLTAKGLEILVETGAGCASFHLDQDYTDARIVSEHAALLGEADILLSVQPPTIEDIDQLPEGATVIGFQHPHENPERIKRLRDRNITSYAVELIPRISRAQSMDALSSQASIAGYKGALLAAEYTSRFFPMLTTAAGTIRPAKVLVIGVGVAGLQAIATAKRLGAMVEAYDVRPETREQVESLGAKFVDVEVTASGSGGYARELTEDEKQHEMEVLARHVAGADAIISTAAVPGRPAPRIITSEMVDKMKHGSVIIDLAAESGGNCELTVPGDAFGYGLVMIYGPLNVPALLPVHASEMYARNLMNFMDLLIHDGELKPDRDDEIVRASTLTHAGEICHAPTREAVEGGQS
jgi:NAD(P) transhydrogenase subunit alpha